MPWIFSYGVEVTPHRAVDILGHAPFCSLPAILEKYKLVFKGNSRKWGGALATLDRKKDSTVHGSAMFLTQADLKKLDNANANFKQIEVKVQIPITNDIVDAITYVLADEAVEVGEPSKEYLKSMTKHLSFFWSGGNNKLKIEDLYKPEPADVKVEKKPEKVEKPDKEKEVKAPETKKEEATPVTTPVDAPAETKRKRGRPRKEIDKPKE